MKDWLRDKGLLEGYGVEDIKISQNPNLELVSFTYNDFKVSIAKHIKEYRVTVEYSVNSPKNKLYFYGREWFDYKEFPSPYEIAKLFDQLTIKYNANHTNILSLKYNLK